MVDAKNGYYIDTITGICKNSTSIIENFKGTDDIPDDVILKLNTKDFTILGKGGKQCILRSKNIKTPEWVVRLLNIAKRYTKLEDEGKITVQIRVMDIGNDNIEVICYVEPELFAETIFRSTSDKFFSNTGAASWLVSYVKNKLTLYDWLDIACIDLLLLVDPRIYKYNDEKGRIKCIRGITKEKGIFSGYKDNYCKDGEYTITEIVCISE